ncbi:MAG: sigma-70 family RNA polymerase sigma factor [Alphaproteobacteria bacterium]|nr:sigma-70 family RNA polymerase sigma factor [Alphaproteobacteria bacterium]
MNGLRNGDAASYEWLIRAHGGRMLAVARRILRNEADAQDCVQDAFMRAFQKIDSFEERASIGSWLHRIVVNAALMKLRQKTRRKETAIEDHLAEFDAQGMRKDGDSVLLRQPDAILESRETRTIVRRAIDGLPEDFRNIILLRDIEEYDTLETADLLDLSPSATKTRLHRARAALKKRLEKLLGEETKRQA